MNKQRGSLSDLAEARIQLLAPNAMCIMRFASSLPPDRPWLRHVLLPQPDVAQDAIRQVVSEPYEPDSIGSNQTACLDVRRQRWRGQDHLVRRHGFALCPGRSQDVDHRKEH